MYDLVSYIRACVDMSIVGTLLVRQREALIHWKEEVVFRCRRWYVCVCVCVYIYIYIYYIYIHTYMLFMYIYIFIIYDIYIYMYAHIYRA